MVLGDYILGAIGIILIVGIIGLLAIGEFFIIKDNWKNKKKRG
jgi:hypothetical protein